MPPRRSACSSACHSSRQRRARFERAEAGEDLVDRYFVVLIRDGRRHQGADAIDPAIADRRQHPIAEAAQLGTLLLEFGDVKETGGQSGDGWAELAAADRAAAWSRMSSPPIGHMAAADERARAQRQGTSFSIHSMRIRSL